MPDSLIITISDETNYGNRLQNFALSSMLSKYAHPSTACFFTSVRDWKSYLKLRVNRSPRLAAIKHRLHPSANPHDLESQRLKKMRLFTKKYMPDDGAELTEFRGFRSKPHKKYSCVVLGSDQIWNPNFMSLEELKLHLGASFDSSTRIVSYAASFGVSSIIDSSAREIFRRYLPRISSISVREDAGQKLVEEFCSRDAAVVLDPTLMIPAEQWLSITHSFVRDDDHYVLTYFLGEPSDEQKRCVRQYAEEHHCRIRKILNLSDPETYIAGPEDFVELFSKAAYVFTDSYHACCFSLLFHKQFTVFSRGGIKSNANMNSRMETLFRWFQLGSIVSDSCMAPPIDYSHVDELLTINRLQSSEWLDDAISSASRS